MLTKQFGQLPNFPMNETSLLAELDHWKNRCTEIDKTKLESEAIDAPKSCDKDIYPTIWKLLQILCTLPITNASGERSFSTLRLMKTWLRTTMLQRRLTGLALLYCHYELDVSPSKCYSTLFKIV